MKKATNKQIINKLVKALRYAKGFILRFDEQDEGELATASDIDDLLAWVKRNRK